MTPGLKGQGRRWPHKRRDRPLLLEVAAPTIPAHLGRRTPLRADHNSMKSSVAIVETAGCHLAGKFPGRRRGSRLVTPRDRRPRRANAPEIRGEPGSAPRPGGGACPRCWGYCHEDLATEAGSCPSRGRREPAWRPVRPVARSCTSGAASPGARRPAACRRSSSAIHVRPVGHVGLSPRQRAVDESQSPDREGRRRAKRGRREGSGAIGRQPGRRAPWLHPPGRL